MGNRIDYAFICHGFMTGSIPWGHLNVYYQVLAGPSRGCWMRRCATGSESIAGRRDAMCSAVRSIRSPRLGGAPGPLPRAVQNPCNFGSFAPMCLEEPVEDDLH